MARQYKARPAATGRGPNGFSFDGELSKISASAEGDQLGRLDLNDLGFDYRGLLNPERGGFAPSCGGELPP
jgi:hypothetical protein